MTTFSPETTLALDSAEIRLAGAFERLPQPRWKPSVPAALTVTEWDTARRLRDLRARYVQILMDAALKADDPTPYLDRIERMLEQTDPVERLITGPR